MLEKYYCELKNHIAIFYTFGLTRFKRKPLMVFFNILAPSRMPYQSIGQHFRAISHFAFGWSINMATHRGYHLLGLILHSSQPSSLFCLIHIFYYLSNKCKNGPFDPLSRKIVHLGSCIARLRSSPTRRLWSCRDKVTSSQSLNCGAFFLLPLCSDC